MKLNSSCLFFYFDLLIHELQHLLLLLLLLLLNISFILQLFHSFVLFQFSLLLLLFAEKFLLLFFLSLFLQIGLDLFAFFVSIVDFFQGLSHLFWFILSFSKFLILSFILFKLVWFWWFFIGNRQGFLLRMFRGFFKFLLWFIEIFMIFNFNYYLI